jgi:hypothetical protein
MAILYTIILYMVTCLFIITLVGFVWSYLKGVHLPKKQYSVATWHRAPCRFVQYLYDDPASRDVRPTVHRSIFNCFGKYTEKLLYKYPICACYRYDGDIFLNRVGWHKKGECPYDEKSKEKGE